MSLRIFILIQTIACTLGLRREEAETVINKGWGEWHPLIQRGILPPNIIMLYAPRNAEELEVAKIVLEHSYAYAKKGFGLSPCDGLS